MADNAEIVGNLHKPVAEEIGKSIVALIKSEFNCMCCFARNIKNLQTESENLKDARDGLQKKVKEDEYNARQSPRAANTWLKNANNIQNDASKIQDESLGVKNGCFMIGSRYSLSRRAKKATDNIKKHLLHLEKLDVTSMPVPPASTTCIPFVPPLEFTSRKHIEEGIIKALMDEKSNMIGICGMGGVGKTTLAKKLQRTVMENGLFNETVLVAVSQIVDLLRIQLEIAECLGMRKIKDVDTLQARAHELRARLRGKKRTLIILDDIWKEISLEEVGIPYERDLKDCTILLTTRNREVLNEMGAEIIEMKILSQEEAWSLFRDKAGTCVDDFDLESIAKEVATECHGLPLAIINVGRALKDKEKCIWEHALDRLKSSNSRKMPHILEKVFEPLRLSYEFLNDEEAQSLLLLCSQFPEDFNISLKDLTLYSFGLNMLEGVDSLRQARNGVVVAIDKLKNSFLLLDGDHENTVKMHDVIRDVIRFIASEKGLVDVHHRSRGHFSSSCKWILEFSVTRIDNEFLDYLMGSNFPSLQLLALQNEYGHWFPSKPLEISNFSFCEDMIELRVLSFQGISFRSFPQKIESLKNLQTLHLHSCKVRNICTIDKLFNLEILCCIKCDNIDEIPLEIGKLKGLKSLEFSRCRNLKRIAPGVISSLIELEELKILDSFKGWESSKTNEKERRNATLKELESLLKLTCLEIEINDVRLVEEEIELPSVKTFKLMFGENSWRSSASALTLDGIGIEIHATSCTYNLRNALALDGLAKEINASSWIHNLARITEELYLEGEGSIKFHLSQIQKTIKSMVVIDCGMLEMLVNTLATSADGKEFGVFPKLEYLSLRDLPKLKELCDGTISEGSMSFKNLRSIHFKRLPSLMHLRSLNQHVSCSNFCEIAIDECNELQNLFSLNRVNNVFVQLKWLVIWECKKINELFINENHGKRSYIKFPKLQGIELHSIPNLTSFGKALESIEFPLLENCPSAIAQSF